MTKEQKAHVKWLVQIAKEQLNQNETEEIIFSAYSGTPQNTMRKAVIMELAEYGYKVGGYPPDETGLMKYYVKLTPQAWERQQNEP